MLNLQTLIGLVGVLVLMYLGRGLWRHRHWLTDPHRRRAVIVYFLAAMFLFYEMAVQVSPSVMTTELMQDFHVNAAGLGLVAGAYFYSYSLMQIPAGLLFDRMNVRGLLTAATAICVLGLGFFASTSGVWQAAMGRFLMGFGSAFAFIGVLVVASRWFDKRYFAFLVGVAQLLAAVGAINGEVPLAQMVGHYGWRHSSLILAAIGVVLMVLIFLIVGESPTAAKQAMKRADRLPWWPSLKRVLANSQTWWVALYAFAAWAPMTAFAELWGVPYMRTMHHLSNAQAATAVSMIWIGLGVTSPILGWLSDRLGRRLILLGTCAFLGLMSSSAVIYVCHMPLWVAYVLLFVFGVGVSGQILSFAVVKDINRQEVTATAIGLNNMAVVIGGAVFQPLVGHLMHDHAVMRHAHDAITYTAADYRFGLAVVPLCFAFGLIASVFFIRETYCRAVDDGEA